MFVSVAECCGPDAIGVMLTGMGADGAQGLLRMKRAGVVTAAQDEASCVVFGMPREAIRAGVVDHTLTLMQITDAVLNEAGRPKARMIS